MPKRSNPIHLALADALGSAGFQRKGENWFRRAEEVVEILNLQKSLYGQQYYLNYGIWLRFLGDEALPREERCHIRMRADAVISSEEQLASLLDLESGMPDVARRSGLADILAAEFLPFAESCRTTTGLRGLLAGGRLRRAMVHVQARSILGTALD